MAYSAFSDVRDWVFDLDNTLYPPSARLFDQIEIRMTDYVMQTLDVDRDRADHLRRHYWQTYGTTLAGLMQEHHVDPGPYLTDVHDISLDHLSSDPALAAAITALPGRKIVYTNGSAPYARRVLSARGLDGIFDGVYGVEDADFHPKPERAAFQKIFARANVTPTLAAMFEDDPRNLIQPYSMGMRTILVSDHPLDQDHIQFHTNDLAAFLHRLG